MMLIDHQFCADDRIHAATMPIGGARPLSLDNEPLGPDQVVPGADYLYIICAASELATKLIRYKTCTLDLKREPGSGVTLSAYRPSPCAIINLISVNPMNGRSGPPCHF